MPPPNPERPEKYLQINAANVMQKKLTRRRQHARRSDDVYFDRTAVLPMWCRIMCEDQRDARQRNLAQMDSLLSNKSSRVAKPANTHTAYVKK